MLPLKPLSAIDIAQRESKDLEAKLISRLAWKASGRSLGRVLIVQVEGDEETRMMLQQAVEWHKRQDDGNRIVGIFAVARIPEIRILLNTLNERDAGGNFKIQVPSLSMVEQIVQMGMTRFYGVGAQDGGVTIEGDRLIPDFDDNYRIILVGHGGSSVAFDLSTAAIATLILAAVRLLSMDYPNKRHIGGVLADTSRYPLTRLPVRVTILSCLSGAASRVVATSSAPLPIAGVSGINSRPLAPSSSLVAKLAKVLSITAHGGLPLTFRIKGYSTFVSGIYNGAQSGFRRVAEIGMTDYFDEERREELVRGRVFAHASVGSGAASRVHVDPMLDAAFSDSEDEL